MTITELKNAPLNEGVAYLLGLIYPLYTEARIDGKECIVGGVRYNANKVTQEELDIHFNKVFKLLNKYFADNMPDLRSNKELGHPLSLKLGFSIIIDKDNLTDNQCKAIFHDMVSEIATSTIAIKSEFVKGCFDGRASWDKTACYIALDIDRNSTKQQLLESIIKSLGISVNLNCRGAGHPKHDQLRIKKDSVKKFMTTIDLYSECKKKIILAAIANM